MTKPPPHGYEPGPDLDDRTCWLCRLSYGEGNHYTPEQLTRLLLEQNRRMRRGREAMIRERRDKMTEALETP